MTHCHHWQRRRHQLGVMTSYSQLVWRHWRRHGSLHRHSLAMSRTVLCQSPPHNSANTSLIISFISIIIILIIIATFCSQTQCTTRSNWQCRNSYSAIAEMAAQCCAGRIFHVKWRYLYLTLSFWVTSGNIVIDQYTTENHSIFLGLHFCRRY